ncbi:MAG: hypothetical protein ABFS38_09645 [Bacteroidota bacterium]
MNTSIEVKENILIRRFEGDVYVDDIVGALKELFSSFDDLTAFKGLVADFLDAEIYHKEENLNILAEYLMENLDRLEHVKVATVIDTPLVTTAIMLDRMFKQVQIRPFTTMAAAMRWIAL